MRWAVATSEQFINIYKHINLLQDQMFTAVDMYVLTQPNSRKRFVSNFIKTKFFYTFNKRTNFHLLKKSIYSSWTLHYSRCIICMIHVLSMPLCCLCTYSSIIVKSGNLSWNQVHQNPAASSSDFIRRNLTSSSVLLYCVY